MYRKLVALYDIDDVVLTRFKISGLLLWIYCRSEHSTTVPVSTVQVQYINTVNRIRNSTRLYAYVIIIH